MTLGVNQSVIGTNAHTYIINSAATLSQNISGNTLRECWYKRNIIFISNSVVVLSSGTQNNNSIVTAFTKSGPGGTVIFFSTAVSIAGAVINHTGNNFRTLQLLELRF
jgi:hypothetical protein